VQEQATDRMTVRASPDRCLAVALDVEQYPEWAADIKQVEVMDRDAEGRPLRVRFRAAAFGRSTTYTLVYDHSGAPEMLSWRLEEGDVTRVLDGWYTFEQVDSGDTEVTYHLVAELLMPVPGFVKRRTEGRIMHTALKELKARAESAQ
jgi:ribosome-associated toxin RatA of RatAB toxin-antitoxin module